MYGRFGIGGVTVGAGGLAATGFGAGWYVLAASLLILTGVMLMRWGRRRGATR